MTQYDTLNVNLSNSQLNKLKSGIKTGNEITLKLSSNVVGDSNEKNSFPYKLLLTNIQVSKLRKAFTKSGGSLDRILEPLLKTGLLLVGIVLKPLAKNVLVPLGSTAAA